MNEFHQSTSEIDRKAFVQAVASALDLRCEPLPPLLTDAIALNSTLARLAPRINYEMHMHQWATTADALRMSSTYTRQHAKLENAAVWHRDAPWGNLVLKLLRPVDPAEVDDGNCDGIALEFLIDAIAEDPLILSYRRSCAHLYQPIDLVLTELIDGQFQRYAGPGAAHPFEGHHFVQGCVVNMFCDASNASARSGVATELSRIVNAELDDEIMSLVELARRTHELTQPV
jgi:hypothetical protein